MNNRRTQEDAQPQGGRPNSKLVYNGDPGDKSGAKGATEKKYQQNHYDPAKEVQQFSYTSGRVAKRVYNDYAPNDKKVFGYYTDWSQYDGRYDGDFSDGGCGRGIDLMLLSATAYDTLILGFAGIIGDKGEMSDTIDGAAKAFGRTTDEATFVDPWGDVASYRNCGFPSYIGEDYKALFYQKTAQGVLGGLRKVQAANPNLILSFSVGGWTMSEAFHWVVADQSRRATLIASLLDILQRFPMFKGFDLDWEYPAAPGDTGNTYSDADAPNFAALIGELRAALDNAGRTDVNISIAASADVEKMKKANLKAMLDAGVFRFNLMTYDFFGTPWAPKLAHHTNLHPSHPGDPSEFSIDAAVTYLEQIGIPLERVAIGYAAYSRSARNAQIASFSPLAGTYDAGSGTTTGSFESGATEWYDLIYNYLDLENQTGISGYSVYTDEVADADYLYSSTSKLFLSVDTPRTVKAKGEYVRQKGLAGLFTWTIDMDAGVLVNAAREGLGNTLSKKVVDMAPFYFKGINVDAGNQPPVAAIDGPTQANVSDTVTYSASRSSDPDGDPLSYQWSAPGLPFDKATTMQVSGKVPQGSAKSYTVGLTVNDGKGGTNSVQTVLSINAQGNRPPVAAIDGPTEAFAGDTVTYSGTRSSDPDGDPLTWLWSAPGLPFDKATTVEVSGAVPQGTATSYAVSLSVSDGKGGSNTDQVSLTVKSQSGQPPVARMLVQLDSGTSFQLSGAKSFDPDGNPLSYAWSAPGLPFDSAKTVTVDGVMPSVTQVTDYLVQLSVNDGTSTSSDTIYLEAKPANAPAVNAVITGKTNVTSGATLSLSGASSTGPGALTYLWSAPGLSFDGSTQMSVSVTAPTVQSTTQYAVQLTVTGNGGSGPASSALATVTVAGAGDMGSWLPQSYPGGSTVTHNYRGQGLHTYFSQWWATQYDEPGNPGCTGTKASDSKVWIDRGPA